MGAVCIGRPEGSVWVGVSMRIAGLRSPALLRALRPVPIVQYLIFDSSDDAHGVITFEAMASTSAAQHAAVMAEVRQVLDWAERRFPQTHGPIDEGMDWDHDLQVSVEEGGWHAVTLTLTASPRFAQEFDAEFGER